MNEVIYPTWAWILFFGIVLSALFVDIGIVNRRSRVPERRETLVWSAVWVSLALAFFGFIYYQFGNFKAKEFLTGYLIELSLSIDNLFVFLLIFKYFGIRGKYQHRVLFWGILMALVMRLLMILAGAALIERFDWLLYVFGAFLIYTGVKMFGEDDAFEPEESAIVRLTTRIIPIKQDYEGESFFIRENGRLVGTMLLLVLIVINVADLVFAVDSIPAIFGVTTDRFIVYTSNIFAILGLRTFYFLLADLANRFHLLRYGLAFVLSFIGLKMLLPLLGTVLLKLLVGDGTSPVIGFLQRYERGEFQQTVINASLGIVIAALVISVILSIIFPHPESGDDDDNVPAATEEH